MSITKRAPISFWSARVLLCAAFLALFLTRAAPAVAENDYNYVASVSGSGTYGLQATLSVTLTHTDAVTPVSGQLVKFFLGEDFIGQASTDLNGYTQVVTGYDNGYDAGTYEDEVKAMWDVYLDPITGILTPVASGEGSGDLVISPYTTRVGFIYTPSDAVIYTHSGQPYNVSFGVGTHLQTGVGGWDIPGTVTVTDGTDSCIGTLTLGFGSCRLTSFTAGLKSLTATYNGNVNFLASTSTDTSEHWVNKANTSTSLGSSVSPSVFGQSVMFNATVSAMSPGGGFPAGSVDFWDNGVLLGTGTLFYGKASYTTSSLGVGIHQITAGYAGDGNYEGSFSSEVTQTVNKAATSIKITSSTNPSVKGQVVDFTFTISAVSPGAGTPAGTAELKVNGSMISVFGQASGGTASLGNLAVGTQAITVVFSGDNHFLASTSASLTQTVSKAATTPVATSSLNPSVKGASVTFAATVSADAPGAGTPAGTVQFKVNGSNFGSAVTLSGGTATIDTSLLSAGAHSIRAVYSGDSNFSTSTSASLSQAVSKAESDITITSSLSPATVTGQAQSVSFSVAAISSGAGTPSGNVVVSDSTDSCTATIAAGSCSLTFRSAGTKIVTATYAGDKVFSGSVSPGVAHLVSAATNSAVTVTSSSETSVSGQAITLTASVSAVPPASGVPTGTVTLKDGSTVLGTGTLADGSATLTISTLSLGTRSLTALYNGESDFTASTSAILYQIVGRTGTSTAVSSSSSQTGYSAPITFIAAVSAAAPSTATPTGTVQFMVDGKNSGSPVALANGSANLALTDLAVGNHMVTAVYLGSTSFNTSVSTALAHVIVKGATEVFVASSINPSAWGQALTFTATVAAPAPGTGAPSGKVQFVVDGKKTGSAVTLNGGVARLTISSLTVGSHVVTASYAGSASFLGSSSSQLTQAVAKAATTVGVSVSGTGTKTVKATVTAVPPGAGNPAGSVQFYVDSVATGGPVTLSRNAAAIKLTLSPGTHVITAVYSGNGNFAGSNADLETGQAT